MSLVTMNELFMGARWNTCGKSGTTLLPFGRHKGILEQRLSRAKRGGRGRCKKAWSHLGEAERVLLALGQDLADDEHEEAAGDGGLGIERNDAVLAGRERKLRGRGGRRG